jgi:hypothetical protein
VLDFYTNRYPNYIGFRIDAVRVTDGTLVGIDDKSTGGKGHHQALPRRVPSGGAPYGYCHRQRRIVDATDAGASSQ